MKYSIFLVLFSASFAFGQAPIIKEPSVIPPSINIQQPQQRANCPCCRNWPHRPNPWFRMRNGVRRLFGIRPLPL